EYKEAVQNGVDITGNDLIEAPDWNLNLAADYQMSLAGGALMFHLDANFVDEQYFDVFNSDDVATESYWTFNGRVAYELDGGNVEFALWAKNLTDNDEYVGRIRAASTEGVFGVAPQPRRF